MRPTDAARRRTLAGKLEGRVPPYKQFLYFLEQWKAGKFSEREADLRFTKWALSDAAMRDFFAFINESLKGANSEHFYNKLKFDAMSTHDKVECVKEFAARISVTRGEQ